MRTLIVASVLLAASSGALAQTLGPTADAYVLDGAWANSNFGAGAELFVKTSNSQNYDSYLKFDTSSVGGAGSVASAKLRISAAMNTGSTAAVTVYAVADTGWSETGITWNNKPALGAALASLTVSGNAFTYYEIDVSNYVIAEKAAGRNVVSFGLHKAASGNQRVWVKARETAGNSPPQLVIVANGAPAVSLTAPANGATFSAPANIPVAATATDPDGTIAKVEFYYGTTLITTLTAAPYSFTWTGVPQGSYVLTAKAFDNNGGTSTSAAVNVTVNAAVAELHFIHVDHLNTPRLVASQSGQTVWRWDQQEPFGVNVPDENPSGLGAFEFPMRFPGQYFDRETSLHHNMARDFDPSIGRYVESDPVGLAGGLNTYVYVKAKPLQFTDPTGLEILCLVEECRLVLEISGPTLKTCYYECPYTGARPTITIHPLLPCRNPLLNRGRYG